MDLVGDVCTILAEVDLNEISCHLVDISAQITGLKQDIKKHYEAKYVQCYPVHEKTSYASNVETMVAEMSTLNERLEAVAQKEIRTLEKDLKQNSITLAEYSKLSHFLKRTVEIHELLLKSKHSLDPCTVAKNLCLADKLLREDDCIEEYVTIYREFVLEYCDIKTCAVVNAESKWNELVSWKVQDIDKKNKYASLVVLSNETPEKTFQTLEMLGNLYSKREVENFSQCLLDNFLKPIILFESKVQTENISKEHILSITYKLKSKIMPFEEVINKLRIVFEFLNNYLALDSASIENFLTQVGRLCDEFIELLIDYQVTDKIPLKRSQLESYNKIAHQLNELQAVLIRKGFFVKEHQLLEEYSADIENLFKNKQSTLYLDNGRKLMKKDLHDMLVVGPLNLEGKVDNNLETEQLTDRQEKVIHIFPKCQISKSMEELIELLRDCLAEAAKIDYSDALTLINTARKILTLFTCVVPKHHRALLDSLPQQSALVYNNAKYLGFSIITLEKEFLDRYKGDISIKQISLVDLYSQLDQLAYEELDKQVMLQRDLNKKTLESSGLKNLSEMEVFDPSIPKGFCQCIRQLTLLQSVWQPVLPSKVYPKIMGRLCTDMIDDLTSLIVNATDFREDVANYLSKSLSIIIDEAPQLFPEPKEINKYVRNWMKLSELGRVLGGSLLDIKERWSSGKGPLAAEFTAHQVHQLVIALFQQSEYRAKVLSSIH